MALDNPQLEVQANVIGVTNPNGSSGGLVLDQYGDTINYNVVVTNPGDVALSGVTLGDSFSDVFTLLPNGDTNNNNLLDPGEVWTFTASHTLTTGDVFSAIFGYSPSPWDNNYNSDSVYVALVLDSTFNAIVPLGLDASLHFTNDPRQYFKIAAVTAIGAVGYISTQYNVIGYENTAATTDPGDQTVLHLSDTEVQEKLAQNGEGVPQTPITNVITVNSAETAPVSVSAGIVFDPYPLPNQAPIVTGPITLPASDEDATLTITSAELLANASDPDGESLSIVNLLASSGVLADQGNGSWIFTPALNDDTAVTFTYRVSDGLASVATTAMLDLLPVNDSAAINGDTSGSVTEDGMLTAGGVLSINDPDAGEAEFQAPASLAGEFGTFTFDAETGAWGYQLNNAADNVQALTAADTRTDVLSVQSLDGTATAEITVTVHGADDGIIGQPGQISVNGTSGSDDIVIGRSNLVVNARAGDDTIHITPGTIIQAHLLNGGGGSDTLDLAAVGSRVSVNLSTGLASGSEIGINSLKSIENATGGAGDDTIVGNNRANVLKGGAGDDHISGQGGADRIEGGAGADVLAGGSGKDTFVFTTPAEGLDIITDFNHKQDVLEISAADFGHGLVANAAVTVIAAANPLTASSSGTAGVFLFDNTGANAGTVYWDANGGSGADAVALVKLVGVHSLVSSDFDVV